MAANGGTRRQTWVPGRLGLPAESRTRIPHGHRGAIRQYRSMPLATEGANNLGSVPGDGAPI